MRRFTGSLTASSSFHLFNVKVVVNGLPKWASAQNNSVFLSIVVVLRWMGNYRRGLVSLVNVHLFFLVLYREEIVPCLIALLLFLSFWGQFIYWWIGLIGNQKSPLLSSSELSLFMRKHWDSLCSGERCKWFPGEHQTVTRTVLSCPGRGTGGVRERKTMIEWTFVCCPAKVSSYR